MLINGRYLLVSLPYFSLCKEVESLPILNYLYFFLILISVYELSKILIWKAELSV